MLKLELSSIVLEIPNGGYTTLSQNLIGCSTLSQSRVMQVDWLTLENNEKATLNIDTPYLHKNLNDLLLSALITVGSWILWSHIR